MFFLGANVRKTWGGGFHTKAETLAQSRGINKVSCVIHMSFFVLLQIH